MLRFFNEGATGTELILVENWAEELRERVGNYFRRTPCAVGSR